MGKEEDFDDVIAEETSRGKARPIKAITRERRRRLAKILAMLRDPACTKSDFLKGLLDVGLTEESPEYQECVRLWDASHKAY